MKFNTKMYFSTLVENMKVYPNGDIKNTKIKRIFPGNSWMISFYKFVVRQSNASKFEKILWKNKKTN